MPESKASEFISSIMTALSNCSLYSKDHPFVAEFSEKAVNLLENLFKEDTLNITILGDTILINEEPLKDTGTHISNFLKKMRKKGIERLVIKRGVDASEFKDFIIKLSSSEKPSSTPHISIGMVEVKFKGEEAELLGLKGELLHEAGLAGLLHDIGKIYVPKEILEKTSGLTPKEWEEMKRHPVYGALYLSTLPEIPRLAVIAAFEHHMKFDGTGYPDTKRYRRKQHIISQMVAIADFFDAMRAHRAYRRSLGVHDVLRLLMDSAGTDFNPLLVENFIDGLKRIHAF